MAIVFATAVPHPPIIVPAVGKGEERVVQATIDSYHTAMTALVNSTPDTIVILSPHAELYADYFHISPGASAQGDFRPFGAPQVRLQVSYDVEFAIALTHAAEDHNIAAGILGQREPALDHGTTVPLYFLQEAAGGTLPCPIVRIGLSGFSLAEHYRFGQQIAATARQLDRNVAIIASGDLSHKLTKDGPYGFVPEGPAYDQRIMDVLGRAAFGELLEFPSALLEDAAECGHRSFTIMAGALDQLAVKAERLSYQGDFGVGYGVVLFQPRAKDSQRNFLEQFQQKEEQKLSVLRTEESPPVALARRTIEHYVRYGDTVQPTREETTQLSDPAGAFVTLKKEGELRGCIGTISPVRPTVAQEIVENAISAAIRDSRFSPVTSQELPLLEYSVDILGEPEDITSHEQLDLQRYGVIVSSGRRRGLLLPNLDGISTIEQQVEIAREKAGIGPDEPYTLQRFEVVRYY